MFENKKSSSATDRAKRLIQKKGGIIRTSEAIKAGVHPRIIYKLRDEGVLEQLNRGVFRLTGYGDLYNPDLVIITKKVPRAVVCLISALGFHEITTQIPHEISIALPKGAETPKLDYPAISTHRFSDSAFKAGVETHLIDELSMNIYSPEKTLADCFKFRNKIGMDIVLEALKLYKTRKKNKPGEIFKYAKICRVENVMKPYLEVLF